MLKLTKKADYALMAMKHLADHAQEGTGSASAKDVADSFGIPPEALAARSPGEDFAATGQGRSAAFAARYEWRIQAGTRGAHHFGF